MMINEIFSVLRNQFEEASNLYERAIQCSRGEEKLMQYAALFYAIRAQGRAVKRLNLNFSWWFSSGCRWCIAKLDGWNGLMIILTVVLSALLCLSQCSSFFHQTTVLRSCFLFFILSNELCFWFC